MAQLALIGCSRVIGRLARDAHVVVATTTTAQNLRVVYLEDRRPTGLAMTLLALGGRSNVFERHRRRFHKAGLAVARNTLARRSLENARDMAAFAICASMSAIEGPAGGEMVKPGTGVRFSECASRDQRKTSDTRGEEQRKRSFLVGVNGELPFRAATLWKPFGRSVAAGCRHLPAGMNNLKCTLRASGAPASRV